MFYAQSVLPGSQAQEKAGRIADALGRARLALDTAEKAANAEPAAANLAGIGAYDPAKYPQAFVEHAGLSLTAAGRAMEASRVEAVAYWGRVLARAGGFFRSMNHDLSPGQ